MKSAVFFLFLLGCAVSGAEVSLKPLFETCSVSVIADPGTRAVSMRFREKDSTHWKEALAPVKLPRQIRAATNGNFFGKDLRDLPVHENEWRGCVVFLKENTPYELEITLHPEGTVLRKEFVTLNPVVKVAKTVYLDDWPAGKTLILEEKGTPDGWIRYTMRKPGSVIRAGKRSSHAVLIRNSSCLLLDNLTIRGGIRYGIALRDSADIRIVNCEISGHAPIWKQALEADGKYLALDGAEQWGSGGIHIQKSSDVLVERCYIHSPAGTANPWFFSHSCGPMAIATRSTGGGLVFRYNDLIGSDLHRWDDTIGGGENSSPTGGFHRDADIYGNMFALGNDDGIEMDGGQSNVRCFLNRFEAMLCGISVAPCIVGPSYVFRNLITDLGDFNNQAGLGLKTVFADLGVGRIHFFNNTAPGIGFPIQKATIERNPRLVTRNNDLAGNWRIYALNFPVDLDYDLFCNPVQQYEKQMKAVLDGAGQEKHAIWAMPSRQKHSFRLKPGSPGWNHGCAIPNFQEKADTALGAFPEENSPDLPWRPIPVSVNRSQIRFHFPGKTAPETLILKAEGAFHSGFRIRKNEGVDWFSVTPEQGTIRAGEELAFTIKLHPEKMPRAKRYKDAFLIRMPDGFSRPVMVYADMRESGELRAKEKGVFLSIDAGELENAKDYPSESGGAIRIDARDGAKPLIWNFDVPEDGIYYFFAHFHTTGIQLNLFDFSVDGDKAAPLARQMLGGDYQIPAWKHIFRIDRPRDKYFEFFRLKKGRHELKIMPGRPVTLGKLAVTNDIEMIYR